MVEVRRNNRDSGYFGPPDGMFIPLGFLSTSRAEILVLQPRSFGYRAGGAHAPFLGRDTHETLSGCAEE